MIPAALLARLVPLKGFIYGAVAVIVLLLIAGNVFLYHALGSANDARVKAESDSKVNFDAAKLCGDKVDGLQKAAIEAAKLAKPKIDAAKSKESTATKRAQTILSTPAAVPGDDCKSAVVRATTWLERN